MRRIGRVPLFLTCWRDLWASGDPVRPFWQFVGHSCWRSSQTSDNRGSARSGTVCGRTRLIDVQGPTLPLRLLQSTSTTRPALVLHFVFNAGRLRRRQQMLIDGEMMWLRRLLPTIFETGVERSAFAVLQYEPLTALVANGRPLPILLLLLLLLLLLKMIITVMMLLLNQGARSGGTDRWRRFAALSARRRRFGLIRFLLELQQAETLQHRCKKDVLRIFLQKKRVFWHYSACIEIKWNMEIWHFRLSQLANSSKPCENSLYEDVFKVSAPSFHTSSKSFDKAQDGLVDGVLW